MRATTLSLAMLALCACTPRGEEQPATDPQAAKTPTVDAAAAGSHAFQDAIDAGDFAEHVKHLASDEFGGRGPGTPGEEKTVEYIKAQFARIGLCLLYTSGRPRGGCWRRVFEEDCSGV